MTLAPPDIAALREVIAATQAAGAEYRARVDDSREDPITRRLCAALTEERDTKAAALSRILALVEGQLSRNPGVLPEGWVLLAHFQWNPGWKVWEQVVPEAAGRAGVIAAYHLVEAAPNTQEDGDK